MSVYNDTWIIVCRWYRYAYNILSYVIAPPFCLFCKTWLLARSVLCDACKARIEPVVSVIVPITKRYSIKVYAMGAYKDPLKKLLLTKSYSDLATISQLASFMADYIVFDDRSFDYIVPIPLHWTRYAYRGFNQSYELASAIAHRCNIPLLPALDRIKKTEFQLHLTKEKRIDNVQNVFSISNDNKQRVAGKRILLIDDLVTTGATVASAGHQLYKAQSVHVCAFVVCRVVL